MAPSAWTYEQKGYCCDWPIEGPILETRMNHTENQ